ncbi:MAG: cupin domain-containing protein [Caldilinea sp. CFX5]|nr:cupin domain-containing protein [Caldilinea sp. CFX5]
MQIYHKSAASGDGPAWVCGHWNGSPLGIGMGLRLAVGDGEARHYHPYREYYVVLEGSAELEVEGTLVPLCAGMVVMVEPGERHQVLSVGEAGVRWVVIQEQSAPDTKFAA